MTTKRNMTGEPLPWSTKPRKNIAHGDIQRTGRKGRYGVHEIQVCCYNCGKVSPPVVGTSPAAPELTGLEHHEIIEHLRST